MIRRQFIVSSLAAMAAAVVAPDNARASVMRERKWGPHPKPRPGITSAKMMSAEQLAGKRAADAFEGVRAIPEIADGIRCHCGCAELPDFYSLLTCYEGPKAMALSCPICQGEGRMAARMHKEGATLDEIRAALDAKYG
jgi:hypothetical protein